MSLKLFDHFGSSWASGRRTSCCGDLTAPQVRGSAASVWRPRRRSCHRRVPSVLLRTAAEGLPGAAGLTYYGKSKAWQKIGEHG